MNLIELTVFAILAAVLAVAAWFVCDDDQWPHV